jgi:branched-chain amino acid transport system ATP-binding protein
VSLLQARGVAVLLVEQKVETALRVADRIAFLEHGCVQATATPEALHADPAPLQRYIGVGLQGVT